MNICSRVKQIYRKLNIWTRWHSWIPWRKKSSKLRQYLEKNCQIVICTSFRKNCWCLKLFACFSESDTFENKVKRVHYLTYLPKCFRKANVHPLPQTKLRDAFSRFKSFHITLTITTMSTLQTSIQFQTYRDRFNDNCDFYAWNLRQK